MTRHFFTGGFMLGDDCCCISCAICGWSNSGKCPAGNALICEAWLQNMDCHRAEPFRRLERTYGHTAAMCWWVFWRVFFISCTELWTHDGSRHWLVSHYLFEKR